MLQVLGAVGALGGALDLHSARPRLLHKTAPLLFDHLSDAELEQRNEEETLSHRSHTLHTGTRLF